jgi:hypothetical protein
MADKNHKSISNMAKKSISAMTETVGCYRCEMWAIYEKGENVLFNMEMHYSKKEVQSIKKGQNTKWIMMIIVVVVVVISAKEIKEIVGEKNPPQNF